MEATCQCSCCLRAWGSLACSWMKSGLSHLQHTAKPSGQTSDLFPSSAPRGCLGGLLSVSLCHCDTLFSSPVAVSLWKLFGLPAVTIISYQDRAEASSLCSSWQKLDSTRLPGSFSHLPPLGLRVKASGLRGSAGTPRGWHFGAGSLFTRWSGSQPIWSRKSKEPGCVFSLLSKSPWEKL